MTPGEGEVCKPQASVKNGGEGRDTPRGYLGKKEEDFSVANERGSRIRKEERVEVRS